MEEQNHAHPLQKLSSDSLLEILEAALPFVDPAFVKPLALYIKMAELQNTALEVDNSSVLSACGLEHQSSNLEDMLQAMSSVGNEEVRSQIETIQTMLNAIRMYQNISDLSKKNPELFHLINSFSEKSSENDSSKQELLMKLLPFLMNSKENDQADFLKTFTEVLKSSK